jgi:hypothetical protein
MAVQVNRYLLKSMQLPARSLATVLRLAAGQFSLSGIVTSCLLVMLPASSIFLPTAGAHNIGWREYYSGNPDNFDNISVAWDAPIPAWIQGIFLRNGPGVVELPGSHRNI